VLFRSGILDGHIWLSRALANRGHYPAVDVLNSISRVAPDVTSAAQRQAAIAVRRVLAIWRDIEDLVSIGAYVPGTNAEYDLAVQMRPVIDAFLTQPQDAGFPFGDTVRALEELGRRLESTRQGLSRRNEEVKRQNAK
jgi:flagellar biosynthesis/type III secretory pathway ATPase